MSKIHQWSVFNSYYHQQVELLMKNQVVNIYFFLSNECCKYIAFYFTWFLYPLITYELKDF